MSLDAINDVMKRSRTTGAARLVLLVIAYHADRQTGDSYCSRRLLAQEANVSTATVHAALGELLTAGEIEILLSGTGRKSTTYRITCSGSAIGESLLKPVVAQSAKRSGSPDGPVVAQSAGPYIGGTEEQGKVEPRASAAPPTGGASRSNGSVPAEASAAIAALKASSRRVPTVPLSQPAPAVPESPSPPVSHVSHVSQASPGSDARPVSAAAANAQQAAPDTAATTPPRRTTRTARGRKGRRGREPPAACTPVRHNTRLEERFAREQLMTLETG